MTLTKTAKAEVPEVARRCGGTQAAEGKSDSNDGLSAGDCLGSAAGDARHERKEEGMESRGIDPERSARRKESKTAWPTKPSCS